MQRLLGPSGFISAHTISEDSVMVCWADQNYYQYNPKARFEVNLGIALLARLNLPQKEIQSVFHVGRNTITRVSAVYEKEGLPGLAAYHYGGTPLAQEIQERVIVLYELHGGKRGYQKRILNEIEREWRAGLLSGSISRSQMHVVLAEQKRKRKKATLTEQPIVGQADPAGGTDMSEPPAAGIPDEPEESLETPAVLDERLTDNGGTSLAIPLINTIGLFSSIPGNQETGSRYSNHELMLSYLLLNLVKDVVVEQDFLHLAAEHLGGIIGRSRIPSLATMVKHMTPLIDQCDIRKIIQATASKARSLLSFTREVYIDGHFMPYYGCSRIMYGYFPQRRMAHQGREYVFVHDSRGNPVYAELSDKYRDMRFYIEMIDRKLRRIYNVGPKELIAIFDRGGYSHEFCKDIAGRIRFICWRTGGKNIPRHPIWEKIPVSTNGNEVGKKRTETLEACEEYGRYDSVSFREIWIRRGDKISPALTNDETQPLAEIVRLLTRRWGAQENMFKELKEHGLDRIHSYRKEQYTEEYLYELGVEEYLKGCRHEISNPEIRRIKKKLRNLKTEQKRYYGKKDVEAKKRYSVIGRKIGSLKRRLEKLPERVNALDRIRKEQIIRLYDKKKLFYDWLKMCAIWVKRYLIELITPSYANLRDRNKFLESLFRCKAYIGMAGDTLQVRLLRNRSARRNEILEHLCERMNELGAISSIATGFSKIVFSVQAVD
jgi:transposase